VRIMNFHLGIRKDAVSATTSLNSSLLLTR
jgi:hypothetical protein